MNRSHVAISMGLFLAALSAACGDNLGLPDPGEAATLKIFHGDGQIGQVGLALGEEVVVRVLDTGERPVADQEVTFTVGSGGGTVAPTTVTTNASGLAAAGWTLGPSAGNQSLRVQTPRGGSTATLEVTFNATAMAGAGSLLVGFAGDDQTGPVNSALADSLVVKVTDALGNPVSGAEVTWSVSGGGGSISPATVFTGADGLAAAERVLGPRAAPQSAQAASGQLTGSPVTFSHIAVPATPTRLVLFDGNNQIGPGGFELGENLVVRLEDAEGNGIGARAISWVVSAGAGSVSPTSATTDPNGLATTRWTLPSQAGTYTNAVSAVFSGLPPVPFTGTATADVPTTIELVSGNNQSAQVGATLPNPLVVRVTDANNNPVPNVGVVWTAVGSGSVSAEGTPTNASGLAQVSRTLGLTPGDYTTTAEVSGLSGSPVTFNSTATVGPPARLAIIIQPGTPTASGAAFNPSPAVQVQDAQGNSVPQGGIAVNVAITSGQANANLDNDQPRNTNGSGRATFTGLRITGPPDNDYILTFSAQVQGVPLTAVSSIPLTVDAGAASRLVVQTQPPAAVVTGTVMSPGPVVQVVDAVGNPVAGSRDIQVTESGPGTLSGTTIVNTGSGSTATFNNLTITGTGTHTLLFSSAGLTSASSGAIEVTAGAPASITIQPGTNNQSATVGQAVPNPPAVLVRDAGNNPVPGVNVAFEVTGGGGVVTPTTVATASNGVATVTSWTLGPTAGANTMTATVSGLAPVTFNATATEASSTTGLSANPTSSTEGDPVTFTANVTSGQGTPTGQVSFRDNGTEIGQGTLDGGGVATFATASLTAGTHPITAHYPGNGTFGPSASTTLDYNVASANLVPAAQSDAFSVDEDAALNVLAPGVLANDVDDDDDLTAQVVSGPAEEDEFNLDENGSFIYTPRADFNGTDSFTYQANDGQANSNVATVTITVNPVNDAPSFTKGEDVEISSSGGGGYEEEDWATGISPGPPDEIAQGQTVQFNVTTNAPPGTFLIPPAVSPDGTLTFIQLPRLDDITDTATVVAVDGPGASSAPQTFTITIHP